MREVHGRSYDIIRRTTQLVAPFFDDFFLEPRALNEDTIRLEWRHRGSDDYFDAASLSDGTLRFIALAALLLQPRELRPSVILLDEPELGMHPYAMTILASLVKQASVETQVVVATQSPLFLDHFEPEDVLVTERVEGETQFTRLDGEKLKIGLRIIASVNFGRRMSLVVGRLRRASVGSQRNEQIARSCGRENREVLQSCQWKTLKVSRI